MMDNKKEARVLKNRASAEKSRKKKDSLIDSLRISLLSTRQEIFNLQIKLQSLNPELFSMQSSSNTLIPYRATLYSSEPAVF